METTFALWLREAGESHSAYALRKSMQKRAVMLLAGVSRQPQRITLLHYPTLAEISRETGIPIQTLIDDAVAAAANPVPPRQYNRKEETDGTQAAE